MPDPRKDARPCVGTITARLGAMATIWGTGKRGRPSRIADQAYAPGVVIFRGEYKLGRELVFFPGFTGKYVTVRRRDVDLTEDDRGTGAEDRA